MVKESKRREVHECGCPDCRQHPRSRVAAEHRRLNRLMAVGDERTRRLLVGFLAERMGRGGISDLACITGLDRKTISRGRRELHDMDDSGPRGAGSVSPRVRRPGGGRRRVETRHPGS